MTTRKIPTLRWPKTVIARAFADAIQHVHKDCKNKHTLLLEQSFYLPTLSMLLFFMEIWSKAVMDPYTYCLEQSPHRFVLGKFKY